MQSPCTAAYGRSRHRKPVKRKNIVLDTLANLLFRCRHRRISRPMTPSAQTKDPDRRTYVVCLDCGKRFAYDLVRMRAGKPITPLR